jgi:hypothetical protein
MTAIGHDRGQHSIMKHIRTRVLGTAVLTAVGLVGTIGGVSYAAGSHGSTPAATSSTAKAAHHRKAGLLGRAEYGQVVVRRHKADVTLDVQRGTLTAVAVTGSTGTITVRSLDGHTQTYQLTSTSKVRTKGSPIALSTLTTGERVGVLAQVSGSTATVTRLAVRPAAATHSSATASPSASSGA